jgi:hypothetical protein
MVGKRAPPGPTSEPCSSSAGGHWERIRHTGQSIHISPDSPGLEWLSFPRHILDMDPVRLDRRRVFEGFEGGLTFASCLRAACNLFQPNTCSYVIPMLLGGEKG